MEAIVALLKELGCNTEVIQKDFGMGGVRKCFRVEMTLTDRQLELLTAFMLEKAFWTTRPT